MSEENRRNLSLNKKGNRRGMGKRNGKPCFSGGDTAYYHALDIYCDEKRNDLKKQGFANWETVPIKIKGDVKVLVTLQCGKKGKCNLGKWIANTAANAKRGGETSNARVDKIVSRYHLSNFDKVLQARREKNAVSPVMGEGKQNEDHEVAVTVNGEEMNPDTLTWKLTDALNQHKKSCRSDQDAADNDFYGPELRALANKAIELMHDRKLGSHNIAMINTYPFSWFKTDQEAAQALAGFFAEHNHLRISKTNFKLYQSLQRLKSKQCHGNLDDNIFTMLKGWGVKFEADKEPSTSEIVQAGGKKVSRRHRMEPDFSDESSSFSTEHQPSHQSKQVLEVAKSPGCYAADISESSDESISRLSSCNHETADLSSNTNTPKKLPANHQNTNNAPTTIECDDGLFDSSDESSQKKRQGCDIEVLTAQAVEAAENKGREQLKFLYRAHIGDPGRKHRSTLKRDLMEKLSK